MEITIQFEAQLRDVADSADTTLSVPDECSVAEALRIAAIKYGSALGQRLVTPEGTPQRSVLLFVNDQAIAHDRAETQRLKSGDTILLYPPISGG